MWRTMLERTDTELLDAISDGDRQALRMLYDRHARWLLLRLHRRSSDAGLNEEVVQDCFVKVWHHSSSYRGEGEVGAWLWTITLRALLDRLRRRTPIPTGASPPDTRIESAEDQILLGLQHGEVGAALDRLTPELRAVLQATVLDGLTVGEASQLLGIPAGTVKSRAMRARRVLRQELA